MSKRDAAERRDARRRERAIRAVEAELAKAEQAGMVRKAGEQNGQTVWQLTEAGVAYAQGLGKP